MAVKFSQFISEALSSPSFLVGYNSSTSQNTQVSYADLVTAFSPGTGTVNYVAKWTGTSVLGNSQIFDNGTNVGIGTPTPTFKLQVNGDFSSSLDATINGVTFGTGAGIISTNNVAGGQAALASNTTGTQNVAIGFNAMTLSTGANCNVAIGHNSLASMTGISFNANVVAIGFNAMNTKTGLIDSNNVVIGSNAMSSGGGTGGQNNVAVGTQALQNLQSGTRNIAIGFQAGRNNVSANNNVALGWQSLSQTTGNQNLGLGYGAGLQITTGSNNVVIGGNFASSIATLSNFMLFCDGAGNERFRIPSTGNVLINTTTDSGYRLDVRGQAYIDNGTGTQAVLRMRTNLGVGFFYGDVNSYLTWSGGFRADGIISLQGGLTSAFGQNYNYNGGNFTNVASIGINTASTAFNLYCNGTIRVDGQRSATAGASSGQHLTINLDGTQYKIALLNNA
jgi:hypothetical protein